MESRPKSGTEPRRIAAAVRSRSRESAATGHEREDLASFQLAFAFGDDRITPLFGVRNNPVKENSAENLESIVRSGPNPNDDQTFPCGPINGVFPTVLNDNSACPQLPQPFYAAPGSSHHAYPGGLRVYEANNDVADINRAD